MEKMSSVPITSYLYARHLVLKSNNLDQFRDDIKREGLVVPVIAGLSLHNANEQDISQMVRGGPRKRCLGAQLGRFASVDVCAEYKSFLIVCQVAKEAKK